MTLIEKRKAWIFIGSLSFIAILVNGGRGYANYIETQRFSVQQRSIQSSQPLSETPTVSYAAPTTAYQNQQPAPADAIQEPSYAPRPESYNNSEPVAVIEAPDSEPIQFARQRKDKPPPTVDKMFNPTGKAMPTVDKMFQSNNKSQPSGADLYQKKDAPTVTSASDSAQGTPLKSDAQSQPQQMSLASERKPPSQADGSNPSDSKGDDLKQSSLPTQQDNHNRTVNSFSDHNQGATDASAQQQKPKKPSIFSQIFQAPKPVVDTSQPKQPKQPNNNSDSNSGKRKKK